MSDSTLSLHVHEAEAGQTARTLKVSTYDDSPLPEGAEPTYRVTSTEEVRQIAASLGVELSRVKFAGGDFEHEADGEQG